ncbi:MAG TPA: NB-ARC domain-containing protein [Anaerolineae bacterium]|nr:NB-ARC domain-containing protein [Anaerolineae bacterium]HNU04501.1 NB-ARC domain-containing protein [Anaerolineae bacterium]
MEPTTLIVTALAAGAAARSSPGAPPPAIDAYDKLSARLAADYPQVNAGLLAVDPGSSDLQAHVRKQLDAAGGGQDAELLRDALAFMQAVQPQSGPAAGALGVNLANVFAAGGVNIHDIHTTYVTYQVGAGAPAAPPPPFQAPAPGPDHVARPDKMQQVLAGLLDGSGRLLPQTVGLHGFGGSGKTILARLVCADAGLRAACPDGILWVEVGKTPPDPRATLTDLVTALTGQCSGCATLNGARDQLRAALAGRRLLLAVDDVWNAAHVADLLKASDGCARLITTRNPRLLPAGALAVELGPMQPEVARDLLGVGLPPGHAARLDALARRLGYWPVLLGLANGTLRYRIDQQQTPPAQALDDAESDLRRRGVVAFDPDDPESPRELAVAATVEASLELLTPDQRSRCTELAIFPPETPIPLTRAAQLWQLTAGLDYDAARDLLTRSLAPLSLLVYDGGSATVRLHDVLRSYFYRSLPDPASLHLSLAARWTDRPPAADSYAWRWLAWHRAAAARASQQPDRHTLSEALLTLVADPTWQQAHEQAVADLPALDDALEAALDAAVADDDPLGIALIVRAADALLAFRREHQRAEPALQLARAGDLAGARRRSELFDVDEHWRQALLLAAAWLAPAGAVDEARKLCDDVTAALGTGGDAALDGLAVWVRFKLWPERWPAPAFTPPFVARAADADLIGQIVRRIGGLPYQREMMISYGLDPDVQNPDMPPREPITSSFQGTGPGLGIVGGDDGDTRSTTRYLAELDGPYLMDYAARHPDEGMAALTQYLSVYGSYSYPEYRYSSLWLLLRHVVQYPRLDGSRWVQEAVEQILAAALGGPSVEFEQGLPTAAAALRAAGGDQTARQALLFQAQRLIAEAMLLKPGRERSDTWARHKRLMLANAQAVGWLLGEQALAGQVLHDALALADSGFAGFQAPACLALAEAIRVCQPANATEIEEALRWAQSAAHNVQDPSFCARMTARVNAMRRDWWPAFPLRDRYQRLPDAAWLPEYASLHRVGQGYDGRRPDALPLPDWARNAHTFEALARLHQRSTEDLRRLNGGEHSLHDGEEVAVPDPGFLPHLAARLAAEILAVADAGIEPIQPLPWLRALVPLAVRSPTALDAVLTRLVLAQGRWNPPADDRLADALDAALAQRPPQPVLASESELIIRPRLPA